MISGGSGVDDPAVMTCLPVAECFKGMSDLPH